MKGRAWKCTHCLGVYCDLVYRKNYRLYICGQCKRVISKKRYGQPSKYNAWKNYRRMQRDGDIVWVRKDGIKAYRKLGYKLVRKKKC